VDEDAVNASVCASVTCQYQAPSKPKLTHIRLWVC